ncbi:MAG: porphobilinogen synthase [Acidimicrobiales bacterium]
MAVHGTFPERRMRRLRGTPRVRDLVSETSLSVTDLVAPLFLREGVDRPIGIQSLPGHFQHTVHSALEECVKYVALGIPGVILFGIPANKDSQGSGAWDPAGVVQVALSTIRDALGDDLVLISDLCLDEYTSHGHCGVLDSRGMVDNDSTLELYQMVAVAQARAGAHIVAPSGMMDGQVAAIRESLDASGLAGTAILAYAAKYASAMYGPFREAVDVQIAGGGDRRAYQQDPRNSREAMLEIALDLAEGADIVMVKPAISYLDIIAQVSSTVDIPVAAYHVSGEYSMVKAAGELGWLDAEAAMMEHLVSIKRAGARFIITYAAGEIAAAVQR